MHTPFLKLGQEASETNLNSVDSTAFADVNSASAERAAGENEATKAVATAPETETEANIAVDTCCKGYAQSMRFTLFSPRPNTSKSSPEGGKVVQHSSAAADALQTSSRDGHRASSLRPHGPPFNQVVRLNKFSKNNVGHGCKEQGCRGGDPAEMAQLNDDKCPLSFCERIGGSGKFGAPFSPVVTISCKNLNKIAGWTPTGARAYMQFDEINLELAPGVKRVTFATYTVVADEKAVQNGGASTLTKHCEAIEINTVRHLNDNRIFSRLFYSLPWLSMVMRILIHKCFRRTCLPLEQS